MPRPRFLYVISFVGYYKIGIALNPRERMRSMMLPGVPTLERLYETPKALKLERELHKGFADKRAHGEWFVLVPSDLESIDAFMKERHE